MSLAAHHAGAAGRTPGAPHAASKAIGAKAKKDEAEAQRLMAEVEQIKQQMPTAEAEQKKYLDQVNDILAGIPNLPADDTPVGVSEDDNVEARRWGEPKRERTMLKSISILAKRSASWISRPRPKCRVRVSSCSPAPCRAWSAPSPI
ncbi:MAG: hypothetical protein R3C40_11115 [Parvularculaceae bacterium]